MKKIYKLAFLILSSTFFYQTAFAQYPNATWTTTGTCTGDEPEITKVYVDACFNPEEQNEFVYMKTGANGWNYSNFSMEGGSSQPTPLTVASNFQPASAAMIAQLNQGLGPTCVAPNNTVFVAGTNPLPANATVMVYPCSIGLGGANLPVGSINYMCGKGPIYVIAGNFNPNGPPNQAFFRNGTNVGSGNKTTIFNFGPCKKTLVYNNKSSNPNPNFPPDQGGNAVGAYVLGNGTIGTSACFEVAPCVGPPNPVFANPTIEICAASFVPAGSFFNCTNCTATGTYSVYTSATDPNSIIYTGNNFPPVGFFPNQTTTTYYIEQTGICASGKTPVTLKVNPAPTNTPTLSAYSLTCAAPTITVSPSGTSQGANFTYQWEGPNGFTSTSLTPTITTGGTYSMTVTNTTTGCTKSVLFPVITDNTAFPQITPTPDKTINCITPAPISIGAASSTAGVTYTWSNGANTAVQAVNTGGTFIVSVTNPNNGCTKKDTVVVTLDNTPPTVNPITAVTVNCTTPTPTLTAVASGGSGLTYAWSPGGGTNSNQSISTGGTYTVTVTNPTNGCKTPQSITISEDKTEPTVVIATPDKLNCINNSIITLNTAGTSTGANFTYNWSGPGGYSSSSVTPPNITTAGTYSVTVTNTTNGCTKVASVTVMDDKVLPTADAGADKILNCINNQSVTIGGASSAGANFTYLWSNGNTAATQTVTTAGTYTITVTNTTNGCTKTDDVTVTQDIVAPVISPIPAVTVNCFTPTPTLNTTVTGSNLVYAWSPSGSGATPTISAGGTYTVTVTNSVNGCTDVESITVPEDKVDPTAVIAAPGILNCTNNSSISLNASGTSTGANFTYNWSVLVVILAMPFLLQMLQLQVLIV